jgi:predicted XRE-type DNA-binding protein
MTPKIPVHDSRDNVFADLNVENPEEYLAKSELAAEILRIIQKRRLTQTVAGKLLHVSQPKISALLNGRLDGFSTDRLLRFLNTLGCDVQIKISAARARHHGRILVTAA